MIVSRDELGEVRTEAGDATLGLRFGSYDLLHKGHQRSIDFTAAHVDMLVIGVMPDTYITKVKGSSRPIRPEDQRVETIDAAQGVDYSFIAPAGFIALAGLFSRLKPDKYIEDENYRLGALKKYFLRLQGIDYVIERKSPDDPTANLSTTQMIARLGLFEAIAKSSLDFNYLE